jgi:hypothetical protein
LAARCNFTLNALSEVSKRLLRASPGTTSRGSVDRGTMACAEGNT